MKSLEYFLRPTQRGLFKILCEMYKGRAYKCDKNFVLVEGEAPIMLLAHLDTAHKEPVREICRDKSRNILMSPQGIGGDGRCGVYALVNAYELSEKKPWLLFTCDEEIGGVGANMFCHMHQDCKFPLGVDNMKCLVEIDRRGSNDAVYYDCANRDFEKYITSKGFKTAWGSFSDISMVAPELGVAAVNLSSGYYNAHTLHEYINRAELDAVLRKVIEIVSDVVKDDFPKYEYIENVYKYYDIESYGSSEFYNCEMNKAFSAASKTVTVKTTTIDDGTGLFEDTVECLNMRELPTEYEELYEELRTMYTETELENERARYGDRVIYELYVEAFGPFYSYDQK